VNQGERRSCGGVSSAFSRTIARCLIARDFLIGLPALQSANQRRSSATGRVCDEPAFTTRPHVMRTPPSPTGRSSCRGCHARKRWSRPVSRVLYVLRRDSHSSRPDVAVWLQQPTREQRGPRYRSPIWSCSEWGLPCRTTLTPYAVRSYRTLSPLPVPLRAIGGLLSVALAVSSRCPGVTWHSALWSPDFPRCACARRDCPADSAHESSRSAPCAR